MSDQKCWLVGTDETGYLLYWTDTRTRARMMGASEMCNSNYHDAFEDAMYMRALRVPDLDDLPGYCADRRAQLIAGVWIECSGCGGRLDLEPYQNDYGETCERKPYMESLASPLIWCERCARDIEGAFEASRDDLLRSVRLERLEAVNG